jgi:phosphatidate cytidylyltransferase
VRDVFSGLFSLVYVAFLASFTVLLVLTENGEWWVLALVGIVVSVDVGAYAAGVTLGKHKMTPRISPNKTWEGFAGAAVAATLAGVAFAVFALQQPWWVGVVLGVVVLLTATGGDLTESLIKRNLGVKDMSGWIPGHGGFLDRLDSILPSAVGVYGVALVLGALS